MQDDQRAAIVVPLLPSTSLIFVIEVRFQPARLQMLFVSCYDVADLVCVAHVLNPRLASASFGRIKTWQYEIQRSNLHHRLKEIIIGNKIDIANSESIMTQRREIPEQEGRAFAEQSGMRYVETSAKTGTTFHITCLLQSTKRARVDETIMCRYQVTRYYMPGNLFFNDRSQHRESFSCSGERSCR